MTSYRLNYDSFASQKIAKVGMNINEISFLLIIEVKRYR